MVVHPAAAQTTFGSITGVVTDPSGAAVPQATVVATNQATNFTRRQTTSTMGVFTIADLVPGTYIVRVDTGGFAPSEKRDVVLSANHVVTADLG